MKLSENKIIKSLNTLVTIAIILYCAFLLINLIYSGVPSNGKGIRGYTIYNVQIYDVARKDNTLYLKTWFNNNVIVNNINRAEINIRYKTFKDLYSFSALSFQFSIFFYWLSIGALLIFMKRFFRSLKNNEVFTQKNASTIMFSSLILLWLPIIRYLSQELLLNCIEKLHLNDSGYALANGESLFGAETFIGLALFAFGLAFRVGVDMKKENEAFI